MKSKNYGLLGKWKWSYFIEKNALWRKVITELHGSKAGFNSNDHRNLRTGVWKKIVKCCHNIDSIGVPFGKSIIRKVGGGSETKFWTDSWCEAGIKLKDLFPRLFALEVEKNCLVSDRWHFCNDIWCGSWNWRFEPRGRATSDLEVLTNICNFFISWSLR